MDSELARRVAGMGRLTEILLYMFYVSLALAPAALIFDAIEYHLLISIRDHALDPLVDVASRADASDRHRLIMGRAQIAVSIVTIILWFAWVFKSNRLARAFGATEMKYGPGWSVGWYFIPILNLFHPYFVMKEIYRATVSPDSYGFSRQPGEQPRSLHFIGWWWLFWIVSGFVSKAAFRYSTRAQSINELVFSSKLVIVAEMAAVVAALTSILVVKRMWAAQEKTFNASIEELPAPIA